VGFPHSFKQKTGPQVYDKDHTERAHQSEKRGADAVSAGGVRSAGFLFLNNFIGVFMKH